MTITLDDPELVQQLERASSASGQSVEAIVLTAVKEKLTEVRSARTPESQVSTAQLKAIQRRVAARPVLDSRSVDDIIGYDRDGLPSL